MEQHRLVRSEYDALRHLYAGRQIMEDCADTLKRRFLLVKGAWNMYKCALGMLNKALALIAQTIPAEDHRKTMRDLRGSYIYIRSGLAAKYTPDDEDLVYLTRTEATQIVTMLQNDGCMLCDLGGKDAKKCKRRQCIEHMVNFAIPHPADSCFWQGYNPDEAALVQGAKDATWEDVEHDAE